MPDLTSILNASAPLTLSGVPGGFLPSLVADLARAAPVRTVFVAPDEAAMRAVAAAAEYFAPELEIVQFPAWDCLPYDRASPTLRIMAERIGALHRLQQKPAGPQLVLTTVGAATSTPSTSASQMPSRPAPRAARVSPAPRRRATRAVVP